MTIEQLDHLMAEAERDEIYREILELQKYYEPRFRQSLLLLSPDDHYCLEMYVRVCVEAEARIARTAYFLTPQK